ncbi:hypothetical protein [Dissulfuribacter thermophilus]|nr:hypothetical protein [Dissulfuribacter thermophilus]
MFRDILLVCDEMGLVGKEMFALDGCKLPSNASKEWSGTRADIEKKCKKLEHAIQAMIEKHRELDQKETDHELISREKKYIETLKKQVKKIRDWMDNNDDKPGRGGGIRKSNIPRLCTSNALERDFF